MTSARRAMPPTGRPWPPSARRGAFRRPEREPGIIGSRCRTAPLRWEQHAEFTTYTWELAGDADPFPPASGAIATVDGGAAPARPAAVAADLHLVTNGDVQRRSTGIFDPASLAVSHDGRRCGHRSPISAPTRAASSASWSSTRGWARHAPVRSSSACWRSRPIARSLCWACPRRRRCHRESRRSRIRSPASHRR